MKCRYPRLLIGILALLASIVAYMLRPTILMADTFPRQPLASEIPTAMQRWNKVSDDVMVVDPTQEAVLNYLYAETFSATYRDANNHRVMLSIAYGRDQADGHDVHKPDLCYPAQGFTILESSVISLALGVEYSIPAQYLKTRRSTRAEPLIYWTTAGDRVYLGKFGKKRVAFEYSLKNLIPDGLVVRVSVIEEDEQLAKRLINNFVADWYASSSDQGLRRFFGKGV